MKTCTQLLTYTVQTAGKRRTGGDARATWGPGNDALAGLQPAVRCPRFRAVHAVNRMTTGSTTFPIRTWPKKSPTKPGTMRRYAGRPP